MRGAPIITRWLYLLHGRAPGAIHVCSTADWVGRLFDAGTQLDQAAAYAATLDDRDDVTGVYCRVTTVDAQRVNRGRRGSIDATVALSCLWADIDIAGPGHKLPAVKDGQPPPLPLPADEHAARGIVDRSGLPDPSVWIHSGGGLYPIWLLDAPHVIDDDLADVADLAALWQRIIGAAAKSAGWRYDVGVGDLTRVLRLPGTVNRKTDDHRLCVFAGGSGQRWPLAVLYRAAAEQAAELLDQHGGEPPSAGLSSTHSAQPEPARTPAPPTGSDAVRLSPGDDYAARVDWADILQPAGWRLAYQRGVARYWRRPGKQGPGVSATTNALGTDRLRVFTTSTDFAAESYSKLGAFAVLHHRGDLHAAAAALAAAGYGDPGNGVADAHAAGELLGHPPPAALTPMNAAPPVVPELDAELRYRETVAAEAQRIRIRRDAAQLVDAQDHEQTWREPPSTLTLTQELELPDQPVSWRIDRLLPAGGNAVLTAAHKAGKTTVCGNLLRALVDGEPFLGRFDVAAPNGRVALFNYEVGPDQHRQWLRDIGVTATDRACVLNVRGFRLPPTAAHIEAWLVKWLADRDVAVWIVDPFTRAFTGCGDENSNTDVGAFLDLLDQIKEQAGVGELVLPVHMGRADNGEGHERARGATRLDDWADARWLLTVDEHARRYLRAVGRDVDVDEELLHFDARTRRLTFGGWDRRGMRSRDLGDELVDVIAATPGLGVNELVDATSRNRNAVVAALRDLQAAHRIMVIEGANRKRAHYVPPHAQRTGDEQ